MFKKKCKEKLHKKEFHSVSLCDTPKDIEYHDIDVAERDKKKLWKKFIHHSQNSLPLIFDDGVLSMYNIHIIKIQFRLSLFHSILFFMCSCYKFFFSLHIDNVCCLLMLQSQGWKLPFQTIYGCRMHMDT